MKKNSKLKKTVRRVKDLSKKYTPAILIMSGFYIGGFIFGGIEGSKEKEDDLGDFEKSVAKKISKAMDVSGDSGLRWIEYQKGLGGISNDEVGQLRVKDLGEFGDEEIEMGIDPDQKLMYVFACGKNES